ncbi:MAG: hypothetical protein ABFC90_04260 [Bacteroidales bacterium]
MRLRLFQDVTSERFNQQDDGQRGGQHREGFGDGVTGYFPMTAFDRADTDKSY